MLSIKSIFVHLMEHDDEFRKAVVGKAALYGMTLYRTASQLASAGMTEPSAGVTEPEAKKRRKRGGQRLTGDELTQAAENNDIIRLGIMKVLNKGRVTTEEIRQGLTNKPASLLKNHQHLTNNMASLVRQGHMRKVPGSKAPNSQWENTAKK